MPAYHPSVPGPVTRPLSGANAATGNVTGVAAQVTVAGGTGTPSGAIPGNVTGVAAHVTVAGGIGTPHGVISAGVVVNQWAATFAQPAAFGPVPPALQSSVIALNSSTSVGGGSGVPSAGNWLFCIAGWQAGATAATVGDADDIHSFWRPGNVTTSTWAVSSPSGETRTSAWYTPNLARVPGDVYVAPSGAMAGRACLVVEVSGIGPWDVVTGINTAYAASARSLALALATPPAASFMIAVVCGDNDSASQIFSPGGWTPLHTVTATNGTNHASDAVLTSAYLASGSSAVSISASAGTAEDLSGVVLAVQLGAPSPIPAGANAAWAGRMILEAGFGSGFETPPDQITWTVLNDSAPSWRAANKPRFWGWTDDSGVPYTLGQLQSSHGTVQLDNADGALSPGNTAGPYYPDVTTGTPVRLRAALGSFTGPLGTTVINRWYTFSRNALEWPEKRNDAWRQFVELATTDIWSVASASCPSPYRGEVLADNPYAWWTCDDQPGVAQVLPASLRNSAPGNANVLNIELSPNGLLPQHPYNNYGYNLDVSGSGTASPTATATYAVNASSGWMYGDPQSSPSSGAAGNPVTASPGAAAWQSGNVFGNTGSYNWFLACNDAGFPPLSAGITVEGWFQYKPYFSGSEVFGNGESIFDTPVALQQPYAPTTLFEIATGSAPAAILQFAIGGTGVPPAPGALNLITYNGGTPTSHAIYSASELRNGSWFHVAATFTPTTWNVLINGGQTANVSGTATGTTSAWTWFLANGDLGASGGSTLSAIQHGGNAQFSHLAIYPSALPAYRIMAHYMAAATGFGLIPTPAGVTVEFGGTLPPGQKLIEPDGSMTTSQAYSALTAYGIVTANIGSYSSGPSAWAVNIQQNIVAPATNRDILAVTWTGLVAPAFSIYTSSSFGTETEAASVCGTADYFTSGFGSGAAGFGNAQIAAGTGASPPATASALGDTVSQRIERCLEYGGIAYPGRSVDTTPNLVQAALDVGGQQCGANVNNLVQSDNGLLSVDNNGTLSYRQKSHLASDTVVWNLSSAGPASGYPFKADQAFDSDPQRVWNVIQISQYSPDGATLPLITPTNASAANTSQQQYGPRPLGSTTSYLQSSTEIQTQANWYLQQFGSLHRRVASLTVDAAGYPPAFLYFFGANIGDLVRVTDQPVLGGPLTVGTYRISSISRRLFFGANQSKPEATITVVCDAEPSSWWS